MMEEEEFLFKVNYLMWQEHQVSMQYEDEKLLAEIRKVIPKDVYIGKNMTQMIAVGRLLRWFKLFMNWVPRGGWSPDPLTCRECGKKMDMDLVVSSTIDGVDWTATWELTRIEKWKCKCGHQFEFPRYNSFTELLETQEGRCGEWARLYTAMLLSLGIEARLVVDQFNDHVWTEAKVVDYDKVHRWVAVDVSDGHIDDPLVYERRLGKEFFYILAFSPDGFVKDVTERYTAKMEETRKRRKHEGRISLAIFDFFTFIMEGRNGKD